MSEAWEVEPRDMTPRIVQITPAQRDSQARARRVFGRRHFGPRLGIAALLAFLLEQPDPRVRLLGKNQRFDLAAHGKPLPHRE